MFKCIGCNEQKSPTDFYPTPNNKRGHQARCIPCWNEAGRQWRTLNKKAAAAYRAEYRKKNRRKVAALTRKSALKTRYGITPSQYSELFVKQGGRCAICDDAPGNGRRLCVDHCHETGAIRALLCDRCNAGLGAFRDDPKIMRKAAEFVMAFMECKP